jgi:hypothetical protein
MKAYMRRMSDGSLDKITEKKRIPFGSKEDTEEELF